MVAERVKNFFSKYYDLLILLFFPLLLIILNSNWIFTSITDLSDPWFYNAYFRYYFTYAPDPSLNHYYYFVERLSWIIPGYILYHLLPEVYANIIIHLGVYYTGTFSLYGILRILYNRKTALLSALVMGSYPWFLRAAGWDYVDGAGISQMLLVMFLLTLAVRYPRRNLSIFMAGIVHASLLISNLFWVGFAPSWAAYYLLIDYQANKTKASRWIKDAFYFVAGNLLLTGLTSIFSYIVVGDFNFLKNSTAIAGAIARNDDSRNLVITFYSRFPHLFHVLPVLLALVCVFRLWKSKREPSRYFLLVIVVYFTIAYGWLTFWHFYGLPYLIVYLYSSYIIPGTFLLFGALMAPLAEAIPDRRFNLVVIFAVLVLSAPFILVTVIPGFEQLQGSVWLLILAGAALFATLLFARKKEFVLLVIVLMGFISYQVGLGADVYLADRDKNYNNFRVVTETSNAIDTFYKGKSYGDIHLWLRHDSSYLSNLAVACLYLFQWGSTINDMPPSALFEVSSKTELKDGNVVILTADDNVEQTLAEANQTLKLKNAQLELIHSKRKAYGDIQIRLIFAKLKLLPITKISSGMTVNFEHSINSSNFYLTERMTNGPSFAWTGPGSVSKIYAAFDPPKQDLKFDICTLGGLKPEVSNSFEVYINKTRVPLAIGKNTECPVLYSGILPKEAIAKNTQEAELTFETSNTFSPSELGMGGDLRKLGIAILWIRIK